jgi:hypothetical protein
LIIKGPLKIGFKINASNLTDYLSAEINFGKCQYIPAQSLPVLIRIRALRLRYNLNQVLSLPD